MLGFFGTVYLVSKYGENLRVDLRHHFPWYTPVPSLFVMGMSDYNPRDATYCNILQQSRPYQVEELRQAASSHICSEIIDHRLQTKDLPSLPQDRNGR